MQLSNSFQFITKNLNTISDKNPNEINKDSFELKSKNMFKILI